MNIPVLVVLGLVSVRALYATSGSVRRVFGGAARAVKQRAERFTARYQRERREAQDPATSAARLGELASSPYLEVLQSVAQNPNSPPSLLQTLSETFPVEVLENPALALILLENPVFLMQLSERALLCLLDSPDVDAYWEHLAKHHEDAVRCAVAAHPRAPLALKEGLLFDKNASVRAAAMKALPLSGDELRWVKRYDLSDTTDDEPLDEDELLRFYERFPLAARFIAMRSNAPLSLLEHLSTSEDSKLRLLVAHHSQSSLALFEALSGDADERVVWAVAANQLVSMSILERLAQHPSCEVRAQIPRARKLPELFLRKLAQSPDEQVLCGVLESLEVPDDLLKTLLLALPNYGDRMLYTAMSNPKYAALVEKLSCEEPDEEARAGLQRTMARWSDLQFRSTSRGWRGTVRRSLTEGSRGILPRVWR